MKPQDILTITREAIRDYASDDPNKWFYANRFVFARLQLDERKTKTHIKKELIESGKPCRYCNKPFETKVGIHLHRLDGDRGYSVDNCELMHPDCHTSYHSEHPQEQSPSQPSRSEDTAPVVPVLEKVSKRYDQKSFLYWWDMSHGFLDKIDKYEAVAFIKRDSGERCHVPTNALKEYLTPQRQTTRGQGHWGIRVLKDREGDLAFEPPNKDEEWLYLAVVWEDDQQDD